jgi:hypothetical protein
VHFQADALTPGATPGHTYPRNIRLDRERIRIARERAGARRNGEARIGRARAKRGAHAALPSRRADTCCHARPHISTQYKTRQRAYKNG